MSRVAVDGLEDRAHRRGTLLADCAEQLARFFEQLLGRDNPVDQSDPERLVGIDHVAAEEKL